MRLHELLEALKDVIEDEDLAGALQVRVWVDVDSETGGVWVCEVDVKRGYAGPRKRSRMRALDRSA